MKEFLSQNGIEFTERNVLVDDSAMASLQKLGLMTTPVTVVDGEPVVGFDEAKLRALLAIK
ncbi:glutaredoxin family protein [Candidatus Zixiibacteriota bacterium]